MGLFSLTKKPEDKRGEQRAGPSFPALPDMEEDSSDVPEFPAYEPTISEIKKEVAKPEIDIPVREKTPQKSMFSAQAKEPFTPSPHLEEMHTPAAASGKTLFVKIDRYKEAMHDLHNLKLKIAEAEKILSALEQFKEEEDAKIQSWASELQEMKSRILAVDSSLFEA